MLFRTRLIILVAVTLGLSIATALVPRIAQDPAYHQFADQRVIFGIPHFFDVASNLPFLLVGAWGLWLALGDSPQAFPQSSERWFYVILFTGVLLTGFGSAYYHWNPNNQTLVWDRLPMTVGFMGLFAATVSERVNRGLGIGLLAPLILLGVASVAYWNRTEIAGAGDLRPYVLVQFGSLLLLILMFVLFPARYTGGKYVIYAFGFYVLAKIFELLDAPIYRGLGILSGHTLKHLAAAVAVAWLGWMLKTRSAISREQ
jgi:hypothetical protein